MVPGRLVPTKLTILRFKNNSDMYRDNAKTPNEIQKNYPSFHGCFYFIIESILQLKLLSYGEESRSVLCLLIRIVAFARHIVLTINLIFI
jgi:hypothetical protein